MKPLFPLLLAALTPAALPAATLVAGWDTFNSATNPTATQVSTGTTASLVTSATSGNWSDWNNNLFGASPDGTFGSLSSSVAAASTFVGDGSGDDTNLSLNRSVKPGSITITLTNNSTEDRLMEGFYFDAVRRLTQSAPDWELTYSGAISGTAASGTLATANMNSATPEQRDWAVDLTGLTDNVWEAGTDAIFTITFSGGANSTGTGGGQETCVDNIGITVVPEPSVMLLGSLGMLALLRRRR
jgi:hypothetical protein